jgi:hypothetical protein
MGFAVVMRAALRENDHLMTSFRDIIHLVRAEKHRSRSTDVHACDARMHAPYSIPSTVAENSLKSIVLM